MPLSIIAERGHRLQRFSETLADLVAEKRLRILDESIERGKFPGGC